MAGKQRSEIVFDRLRNRISDWKYGGSAALPQSAIDYLQPGNPRLHELEQRYAAVPGLEHSVWSWHRSRLTRFRGEGDFLSQATRDSLSAYTASFGYAMALDAAGMFQRLTEDSLFGVHIYNILGKTVTRDLIDSTLEIQFLDDTIGLADSSQPRVILDIGAGYGRLAYRLVNVFPQVQVMCTDGVPASTFMAEFYLRFRQAANASVLPLDEVSTFKGRIDLASNIHSWSECTLQSIRWWLDQLDVLRPRHLFVVPHSEAGLAREGDGTRPTFLPDIAARGWKLVAKRHKYYRSALLMEKGIFPAWYFLFER